MPHLIPHGDYRIPLVSGYSIIMGWVLLGGESCGGANPASGLKGAIFGKDKRKREIFMYCVVELNTWEPISIRTVGPFESEQEASDFAETMLRIENNEYISYEVYPLLGAMVVEREALADAGIEE